MGSHRDAQLDLWNDLSHIITYTQEMSHAYRKAMEDQEPNVEELTEALKKSAEHCHYTLEEMLRSFLLPENANDGNTSLEQPRNNNLNGEDKSAPLLSNNSRFGQPTREEPPPPPPPPQPFSSNNIRRNRRSVSLERRKLCLFPASCYVVSPRKSPENNDYFRMHSRSHESQFLHAPNHTVETKRLRYRSRSHSPQQQYQPVYRPVIRSNVSLPKSRPPHSQLRQPQSEPRNDPPLEFYYEQSKNLSKPSRSSSKNRKSKSPNKRQIRSPLMSRSHYPIKTPIRVPVKNHYSKVSSKSRSPPSPKHRSRRSPRSRSPPSPRYRSRSSPKSRSPPSPRRRRRRTRTPPRSRIIHHLSRKYNKSEKRKKSKSKSKSKSTYKPSAQGNAKKKQNNQIPDPNFITMPVYPGPRAYFPRPYQPMFYGQPGLMPPPQFAPRPPVPYFMPHRPRIMPYPPYRNYFPPNQS